MLCGKELLLSEEVLGKNVFVFPSKDSELISSVIKRNTGSQLSNNNN